MSYCISNRIMLFQKGSNDLFDIFVALNQLYLFLKNITTEISNKFYLFLTLNKRNNTYYENLLLVLIY